MNDERAEPELSRLDPTGRFTNRADDYRRYRPSYPAAAIDAVLRDLGDPRRLEITDVGAGTGISARLLAERGARVIAIEPNAAMRDAAEAHRLVTWRDGTAEATGLPVASVEVVVCAQAFHWFRVPEALVEFHRILRAQGRLALVWNNRDHADPLTRGYIAAIHAVQGEHPAERTPPDLTALAASGRFTAPGVERFPYFQELDLEGLVGRSTSASYVPREGERFERLRELLAALHARHADAHGRVTLRYVTTVYLATRI